MSGRQNYDQETKIEKKDGTSNVFWSKTILLSDTIRGEETKIERKLNEPCLLVKKHKPILPNVFMLNVIMLNVVMLNVIMLNVVMLNVIMLNVVMLNVFMLNVVMLNVVMLNVVTPIFSRLLNFYL